MTSCHLTTAAAEVEGLESAIVDVCTRLRDIDAVEVQLEVSY